ncbi:RNA polymerase sigma factor [Mucilaginibacter phyllosphaerae]|uniref:RNA polymerase sigma factor n=1 Tax=Mucilaginibacter phyllosphaerae TaxID=1812349 RepID=A0A4Y8AKF7_9SPHI|nr:RNA polymerase sigma factor [Mucilaginibacter phyllosphaerae]MBB3967834.1 RNA polymerase sigma-70 factor (ECF subfamily) [Mucilaginibacter phyllosphaerae]TEW69122.1 RNA polymerase sigma factor [Mucilaginibacter phyllosphaerae]
MHLLHRITEEEIVSRCKSGSLKHQELLYKQFYGYAMGVSMRYSHNQDDALEVVNDAFIKIFNNINTYNTDKPFRAWLRTIVVNTAIDRRRKELKHQSNTDIEHAYSVGSDASAIDNLNAQDILKLMKQLPQIQLTIFNMYEIDGYNHDEIGKILNLPASSSRVYLSRAKEKLRHLLTTETRHHE